MTVGCLYGAISPGSRSGTPGAARNPRSSRFKHSPNASSLLTSNSHLSLLPAGGLPITFIQPTSHGVQPSHLCSCLSSLPRDLWCGCFCQGRAKPWCCVLSTADRVLLHLQSVRPKQFKKHTQITASLQKNFFFFNLEMQLYT